MNTFEGVKLFVPLHHTHDFHQDFN